jgi:hypothetical protein
MMRNVRLMDHPGLMTNTTPVTMSGNEQHIMKYHQQVGSTNPNLDVLSARVADTTRRYSLSGNEMGMGNNTTDMFPALTLQELDKIDTSQHGTALLLDAKIHQSSDDEKQSDGDKLDKFDFLEESIQQLKKKRLTLLEQLGHNATTTTTTTTSTSTSNVYPSKTYDDDDDEPQYYKRAPAVRRDSLYSLSHSRRNSMDVTASLPDRDVTPPGSLPDDSTRTIDLLNESLYPLVDQSIRDYVMNQQQQQQQSRLMKRFYRPPDPLSVPTYPLSATTAVMLQNHMMHQPEQNDGVNPNLNYLMSEQCINNLIDAPTVMYNIDTNAVKDIFDGFSNSMNESLKSQQCIHEWDKKMGLKRSHSKTMRMSMRTRKKLRIALKKDMMQTISSSLLLFRSSNDSSNTK